MKTIADHNEWRGKANLDDGEWTTFVDPDTSPDVFDHRSDVVKVKFMGESWETGPRRCRPTPTARRLGPWRSE